jgi:FxLD family lantipeptide
MTVQMDDLAAPGLTAADEDFDLDVSIVESGPVIAELMRNTDDGCGQSCQSACAGSGC